MSEIIIIKQGYKLEIGRNRTRVTTYENLRLNTGDQNREEKSKKNNTDTSDKKLPSDYADYNYCNRIKQRRKKLEN